MKKVLALICACLLLCGCTGQTVDPTGDNTGKITLNIYNWGQYIADGSDGSLDVIAAFEEKYPNIHVNYSTFDSNEVMYTKLASGGITVDLIFPSDYMVARLRQEGMLQKLNFDNIPNYKYVDESFKNLAYDPDNEYSVPYTWGTVGIIYNTKYVSEADVTGWELLWNEKYADKILMFDNSRDAMAITQYLLGYDVNTTDEAALRDCAQKLKEQKPLVQQYVMDQVYDLMENEEAWIAPYYAGDFVQMAAENENLAFYLPQNQGFNLFTDAACIPSCAKEKEAAELFINFLCEPEISGANMDWVCYGTPLSAAKDYLDPEIANDPNAYPAAEILAHGTAFDYLQPSVSRFVESLFLKVRIS